MLEISWLFSLVFLGTAWSVVPLEEVKSSETGSLPSFEMIESVLRSSFENVSRKHLLGGVSSRVYGDNMPQEAMSYLQHGMHAPNAESWKMACVWDAMSNAARYLQQVLPEARKSDTLEELVEVRGLCTSLAMSSCGANFNTLNCDPNFEYRSVNGTCNNLQNTRWGAASQPFERYLQADYGDGVSDFRTSKKGRELPNPRSISQILSNSAQRNEPKVTLMLVHWGQFIDHDITLTPEMERHESIKESKTLMCCDKGQYHNSESLGKDCRPIDVQKDIFFKKDSRQCIRFVRSMPATKGCSFTPMEQINQNTAFIDGSQVYGSTEEIAYFLRQNTTGLLKVTLHEGTGQPLPPRGGQNFGRECPVPESMEKCFLAGDDRVDEVPGLTAMHTAFIRLHNIIAESLHNLNTKWDDEMLYQETRRIVSALTQQITYRDWLPHVLGPTLIKEFNLDTGIQGYKYTYNPSVNPTIKNVFSTAALRFGHSLVTDMVKAATDQMSLPLEGHFFNMSVVQRDGTNPSSLLKGMTRCPSGPIDGFVANTLTDKLFATPRASDGEFFGLDLVSLNIQRGRDHGIPSYNEWRHFCGLETIKDFIHLESVMEKDIAQSFDHVYKNINDVDLFPAGLSEFPRDDGLLGPTFSCILARQFDQLKHGDRFWYENEDQPKPFTTAQLTSIRNQSLASILCMVSEHTNYAFQKDPFLVSEIPGNEENDCSNMNSIDLQPWKVCPDGFFMSTGSNQCFKYFNDERRNWAQANSKCIDEGLQLAEPSDAVAAALRKTILDKYGEGEVWVGAQGNGVSLVWQSSGTMISNESPLWWGGEPGPDIQNEHCVLLLVWNFSVLHGPKSPYTSGLCRITWYTLCEDVCGSIGGVRIGSQCLTFSTEELSWADATASCANSNLQLASLADNPDGVLDYVVTNYDNVKFWLGGSDITTEGTWLWVNGVLFDQFPWLSGQPDNYGNNEDCLMVNYLGGYNDDPCEVKYRYICELGGGEDCTDKHASCQGWADRGECEKNPNYMLTSCARACNQCGGGSAADLADLSNGFEVYNDRLIRRTKNTDQRRNWDEAMAFCSQYGAKPFIPRTNQDYQLYKEAQTTLAEVQWLPANDRVEEGTLRWYTGELVSDPSLWEWYGNRVMDSNADGSDCLFYTWCGVFCGAHLYPCNSKRHPPICEKNYN